nr:TPA_asm: hypothetical protein HUJ06_002865 [Nelumbo nucifera]
MAHPSFFIEMEPRTLSEGELKDVRVAAVDIIKKLEAKKATDVFIEGLSPVVSIKDMEKLVKRRDELHKLEKCEEVAQVTDCSCTSVNVDESPDKAKLREPLSAPF